MRAPLYRARPQFANMRPGLHLLQGADLLVELPLAFALGGDQARLLLLGQAPPSGQVDQEYLIAVTACPPHPLLPQVASVS